MRPVRACPRRERRGGGRGKSLTSQSFSSSTSIPFPTLLKIIRQLSHVAKLVRSKYSSFNCPSRGHNNLSKFLDSRTTRWNAIFSNLGARTVAGFSSSSSRGRGAVAYALRNSSQRASTRDGHARRRRPIVEEVRRPWGPKRWWKKGVSMAQQERRRIGREVERGEERRRRDSRRVGEERSNCSPDGVGEGVQWCFA